MCGFVGMRVTQDIPAEETGECVITPNIPCCSFLTPVGIGECLISPVYYIVAQGDNIFFLQVWLNP